MSRKKRNDGKWKPRKLKCHVCKDPFLEREPTALQRVTKVEAICRKCEQREWDAYHGKKPVPNEAVKEVYREWNVKSGWGEEKRD